MGSDQPERPAREGKPLWVDPDWWKDVLRTDGTPVDPLIDPLPSLAPAPPVEPADGRPPASADPTTVQAVPAADQVPSADSLLGEPASAPRSAPRTDVDVARPVDAPPVEAGPLPTVVPQDPPGLPEGGAPAAPDLLADPHAAPPPQGTAAPLAASVPTPVAEPPVRAPAATAPPAVARPRELHVPRVGGPSPTSAPSPVVERPPRRAVREVVGARVADVGLVLLALAVVALVYLALTR